MFEAPSRIAINQGIVKNLFTGDPGRDIGRIPADVPEVEASVTRWVPTAEIVNPPLLCVTPLAMKMFMKQHAKFRHSSARIRPAMWLAKAADVADIRSTR
jgi:hypothetical protein